ncbi:aromatic-ring-hydroxylating dioxygenase subunit beta [Rhodoferax ferrireducens]|uniref:aromatic-ring-hydroxylating dioxygenase subunit beta n=1 Tax=Rhodoferax ferrireducens TaxID=192843 RepID=UPI000E0D9146|nr:aromatic-ring-hydroxylating dioxygenase subunit beta [Rhodoferax ferrireducens]
MSQPSHAQLIDFVHAEARLLNAGRHDEWLALFAPDGHYWVPLQGAQQVDAQHHNSIAYEDRLLLSLRIERLKNPRAFSQQPVSRSQHVLQLPQVDLVDHGGNVYELYTPFFYAEARGEQQTLLTGAWRHQLRLEQGQLRIVLKRVDLLNAQAAHVAIQLFP